jgi:hypothetical protein
MSYLGVRLSDAILNITYSPDGFLTVAIVAVSLAGFATLVGLVLSLAVQRGQTPGTAWAILWSVTAWGLCSIGTFLVYVQCDTVGIEYLFELPPSEITENVGRALVTAILPAEFGLWFYIVARVKLMSQPSAPLDRQGRPGLGDQ